jgi:hypothetical protein
MRVLIVLLLTTLANLANAAQPNSFIDVQHDAHRGVTCWIVNGTGISCLPDSQLLPATPSSEAARASKTGFMCQNDQLPANPEEIFQL